MRITHLPTPLQLSTDASGVVIDEPAPALGGNGLLQPKRVVSMRRYVRAGALQDVSPPRRAAIINTSVVTRPPIPSLPPHTLAHRPTRRAQEAATITIKGETDGTQDSAELGTHEAPGKEIDSVATEPKASSVQVRRVADC